MNGPFQSPNSGRNLSAGSSAQTPPSGKPDHSGRRRKWLQILKWTAVTGTLLGCLGGGIAFGVVSSLVSDDPIRDRALIQSKVSENNVTGFVYFSDNRLIGQLRADEDRRLVPLKDVPDKVRQAFFAIEDNRFYEHIGIDWFGLVRALKQRALNEEVQTGGSTITQQLARNVFLTLDRSTTRKAKEIFLSLRLERLLSKDEILEAYLNKIPFGQGSSGYNLHGIAAAAKGLFGYENLNDLNIAQCAYIAGLPQQPSNFSAFNSRGKFEERKFNRAMQRQRLVLDRMLEEKRITRAEYVDAVAFDLKSSLAKPEAKAYTTYPWPMLEAEKQAAEILLKIEHGEETATWEKADFDEALKGALDQLTREGYRIYTTIDQPLYDAMKAIGSNPKNFSKDDLETGKIEQVGAMLIENKTGAILSMVEGRDYSIEQLNHATQAYRQPGSAMKPLAAFLPALDRGLIQPASIIDDVPLIMEDGMKGVHVPVNHDGKYHGLITAREALNQSYNIPALKIFLNMVGIQPAWDFVRKIGITSLIEADNTAQTGVIGGLTQGITVKEMTNAYATIPNGGAYVPAYLIRKIENAQGRIVYENQSIRSQVYSPQTAFLMTDMLRTVIDNGTAGLIKRNYKFTGKVPIAGKTGTTQSNTDVWFIGFTPDVTLGVWVGYDKPVFKLSKANGGTNRAKEMWYKLINDILKTKPELTETEKTFPVPDKVTQMTVSSVSGLLPNDAVKSAGKLVTDWFNQAYVPTTVDNMMVPTTVTLEKGLPVLPKAGTPEDFLKTSVSIKRNLDLQSLLSQIEASNKLLAEKDPKMKIKPINEYIPLDAAQSAPVRTDSRSDDGMVPEVPQGLSVQPVKTWQEIRFEMPAEPADLIGYRLYRSIDGGDFEKVSGKVIFAGAAKTFTDKPPKDAMVQYAVTAVDVAGNESALSEPVLLIQ